MTFQAKPAFPHRHNSDGLVDSICSDCLLTIASVSDELESTCHEQVRVCDPVRIYQFWGLARQPASPMSIATRRRHRYFPAL
jgi:hypothetical protein